MATSRIRPGLIVIVALALMSAACAATTTTTTVEPAISAEQEPDTTTAEPPAEPTQPPEPASTPEAAEPPTPEPTPSTEATATPEPATSDGEQVDEAEFQPFPVAGSIDTVDFLNGFTYAPGWGPRVTVTDGAVTIGSFGDENYFDFQVIDVAYGDLDGDALDEAAVTAAANTGGSGFFTSVAVYRVVDGRLQLAGETNGGDRADGGVYDAYISGGFLTVESFATDQGACCPNMLSQTRWALGEQSLIPVEVFATRTWMSVGSSGDVPELVFRPNTTSATVAVYGYENEGRFTFSAGAGQQVRISAVAGPRPWNITVSETASGDEVAASDAAVDLELSATGTYEVEAQFAEGDRDRTSLQVSISDRPLEGLPTWSPRFDQTIVSVDPPVSIMATWPAFETATAGADLALVNAEIERYVYGVLDPWLEDVEVRPDPNSESTFDLWYEILMVSPDLVSIHFDYYEYVCCRPYPNLGQRALIIDLSTGYVIEPGDVVDIDRLDELQALWAEALERDNEYLSDVDLPPGLVGFSTISLLPTGIEIGTDRGMFGGAAQGPTRTLLTFEELGDLVNPDIVSRARAGFVPQAPSSGD